MKKKFFIFLILFSILINLFSKSDKNSDFKWGIGFNISTNNLLGLIETIKMSEAIESGNDYNYPGLTE